MTAQVYGLEPLLCARGILGSVGSVVNRILSPYFDLSKIDTKVGFSFSNCRDLSLRKALQFFVSMFSPNEPSCTTKKLVATIIQAWKGEYCVDWARHLNKMLQRQIRVLETRKTTNLSSFVSHIYFHHNLLSKEEKKVYALQKLNAKLQVLSKVEETSDLWANLEDDNFDVGIKKSGRRLVSQTPSSAQAVIQRSKWKINHPVVKG